MYFIHCSRHIVPAKRRKPSSSGSSSGSGYSSSSQSRSGSRSSYSSSRSSSPSHSHSSRTSSPSSRSRSFSSRQSSSYSRSTISSSSRSPSASPHSRSKKARLAGGKVHKPLDKKLTPNSKRQRSPPLMRSKNWQGDPLKYKPREESSHRRKVLPHDDFPADHSYRHRGRSRSPHRLGDKFVEPSRRPVHYGRDSPPPRRHPRPHSPPRDRRVIRQIRRSPPPIENDRHPRERMRRSFSPPGLRPRSRHSPPPPPPPMRRRPRMRSLERLERPRRMRSLERLDRPRRPIERSSLGREEPHRRPRERSRHDTVSRVDERHRHSTKTARETGSSSSRTNRHIGKPGSDTEQEVKRRTEKKARRESTGGAKK